MKKRKDECLFCSSRSCYTRVYRREAPVYDEVACDKHVQDLYNHTDKILDTGKYTRNHYQGTRKKKRGEIYRWELGETKKED